jgi:hypothetical protein
MPLKIFKNRVTAAKQRAKADYLKAASLRGDSRQVQAFKMRVSHRCRAHVDNAFIEGAKKTARFHERCATAVARGNARPKPPKCSEFHSAKSINGTVFTYLPIEFSEEIFTIGARYQTMAIEAFKAINLTQEVVDKISFDLGLEEPFTGLQFLRDELMDEEDDPSEIVQSDEDNSAVFET